MLAGMAAILLKATQRVSREFRQTNSSSGICVSLLPLRLSRNSAVQSQMEGGSWASWL